MASAPSRIIGPMQPTNADALAYTVPAATLAVLRTIHVSNPTGGAVTLTLSIGADGVTTRLYDAYSIGAGVVTDLYPRVTLQPGETLRVHASAGASLNLTVDADLKTLG